MSLKELFAGRRVHILEMRQRLAETAKSLGLPFGERIMSFNSRRAQEAAKWAESHGRADPYHNAIFQAYFVDGKNLHTIETLTAAAESVGLNGAELAEALQRGAFQASVDQDWLRSRQMRITAVPTFRLYGENLVGAQPYEELAAFLRNRRVPERKFANPP